MVFRVIHESHDADRSGSQAEIFLHMVIIRKGKSRGTDLFGENLRLEFLMSRHQEKVELRLLGVAEKEVLADMDSQDLVCAGAGIDRECGFVVDAGVGDIQGVEKIVSADLCLDSSGDVLWASGFGNRGIGFVIHDLFSGSVWSVQMLRPFLKM